jgi:hypothetical protein
MMCQIQLIITIDDKFMPRPESLRDILFGDGKKEAPAIDEGEEARLCGGLWTRLLNSIL